MQIQNIITKHDLSSFEKLKTFLSKEPFNLFVKGNDKKAVLVANKYKPLTKLMKDSDGCVVDVQNKKVVCYSPYFDRIEVNNQDEYKSTFEWNQDTIVEELIDGTVMRIYYDDDEWKIATLRTYDAEKAYWFSSKSFKELFLECAENLLNFDELNKSYIYGFIIRHPENKYVTHYNLKDLVHVFTVDREQGFKNVEVDLKIVKPQQVKFDSFNQMIEQCRKLLFYQPGFLITDNDGNKIKYIAPHYTHVKNLKGNIQKMDVRYLQLRNSANINEFKMYYPEYLPMIQEIEKMILKKVNDLYKKYVDIKIKKIWYDLEKIDQQVIYNVHSIYLQTKVPINFQIIYNYFSSLPYYKIAIALNIPLTNQRTQQSQQESQQESQQKTE